MVDREDGAQLLGEPLRSIDWLMREAGYGPDGSTFSISGLGSSHLVIDGVEQFVPVPWPDRRLVLAADW